MSDIRVRRQHLHFSAIFVANAFLCLGMTASAQTPVAKMPGYTEFTDRSASERSFTSYSGLQFANTVKPTGIQGPSTVHAVSANGGMAAGVFCASKCEHSDREIFLWSKAGGVIDIAKFSPSYAIRVVFISDDGSVVVWEQAKLRKGTYEDYHLIRWSKAGGAQDLGAIRDYNSVTGVSANGTEIVGQASLFQHPHAFRWTQQRGLQDFPDVDRPLYVSVDGMVIVGLKDGDQVVRWTEAGGAKNLGTLKTEGTIRFYPCAASADGTVVGFLDIPKHDSVPGMTHAFIWTRAGGLQDLGEFDGLEKVSADGKVAMGTRAGGTVYFVSPVADLLAKKEAEVKHQQEQAQAQSDARAAEQAKLDAIAIDQQNRYEKAVKHGRPIQIYSLAGDMLDEGRPDLAASLYQTLIDKFPDDPYAAKAVDKKDAAREAAAQQQQQVQDSAGQQAASNASSPQAVEACIQECRSTLNSCKADAQNQHDSAVAKGLVGMISKNAGMVGDAGTDSQNADSAKSACEDAYNSCSSSCQ
jgi:uncharacterized membrane protein